MALFNSDTSVTSAKRAQGLVIVCMHAHVHAVGARSLSGSQLPRSTHINCHFDLLLHSLSFRLLSEHTCMWNKVEKKNDVIYQH